MRRDIGSRSGQAATCNAARCGAAYRAARCMLGRAWPGRRRTDRVVTRGLFVRNGIAGGSARGRWKAHVCRAACVTRGRLLVAAHAGRRRRTAVCEKNGWSSAASAVMSSRLGNVFIFVCRTCRADAMSGTYHTMSCNALAPSVTAIEIDGWIDAYLPPPHPLPNPCGDLDPSVPE